MDDWILIPLLSYSFAYWLTVHTQGRYPPPPPPYRFRIVDLVVGIVGGVAGGWLAARALGPTPQPAVSYSSLAAITAGVFIGVTVVSSVYYLVGGRQAEKGPQL
jgi:uncharacterized membrane protein YeaQ/YmgE (transglycosylase-associated protein family)